MPMRGPRGVEPTRILQRVGPSWDVGCATDRLDERPAAPLHQFTPNADAEAHLVLPGGALALERCWGVRSLVERCLAFLVQQHPMLFWGWHGSQAAAEWLTLEFESRGYYTISAILPMAKMPPRPNYTLKKCMQKTLNFIAVSIKSCGAKKGKEARGGGCTSRCHLRRRRRAAPPTSVVDDRCPRGQDRLKG